ncbi:uncharacterized protein LOC121856862 [Homarus americanus]|uniref:HAUS augmin-like complex subunit 1-like n=1 Tax=Homarus americanus TaxID=6706 RepID=A0A8J5JBP2_HOMAM|nr:uncharacterized protein LOC121856862 [Homarus americanus]XP_042208574.1 uncharacterized protein LOC121856862 [Homarus americanus]KAG7153971.1 HAUS augmin-like complex subunit 1-like [Homarus americanus]
MDIKHREVVQWLQEIYGKDQIPPYEKAETSINILHQLMTASKCSEGNAKLLADDYSQKSSEYGAEARQLSKWMEPVKIKTNMLSNEGQKGLSALAATAQAYDIQTVTSTNIILAMNQLDLDHMQVVNDREQERGRTSRLLEMSQDLSRKFKEIKGIFQQSEATWAQQQEEHARDIKQEEFIRRKFKKYVSDINQYEARLSQVGMKKNITHAFLSEQWAKLKDLEKQVSDLENQLKSYTLPPDITLAEVKVQEAHEELAALLNNLATKC